MSDIRDKAPDFVQSVGFQVSLEAVIAIIYAVWSVMQHDLPLPVAIGWGLLVFVCLVWLTDRFFRPTVKYQIRSWLDGTPFKIQTIHDDPKIDFGWEVTDAFGRVCTVTKPSGREFIDFRTMVEMQDDVLAAWKAKSNIEQRRIKLEASKHMYPAQVSFSFKDMTKVEVTRRLPLMPQTNMRDFGEEYRRVNGTGKLLANLIKEALIPWGSGPHA